MKKLFFTIIVVLFLSPSLYAQSDVNDTAHKKAEAFWNNMTPDDYTDVKTLDNFIAKFPDTAWARVAFAFRYSLVANNPSIEDYNAFLAKYPDRMQSQFAIHEVFKLYREQDRVSTYLDFIKKYPHAAEHTLVAKMRMQTLMFEFVCLVDALPDYEAFIATFPDAPQIQAVAKLAYKKVLENEKQEFDKTPKIEREKRANEVVFDWGQLITDYNKEYTNTKLTEDGNCMLHAFRIQWQEKVIAEIYKQYKAALEVREEARHNELIKKLNEINETLKNNHAELVQTIREESEKTRKVLREEFAKLGSKIEAGFDKLSNKLDKLHEELVTVNNTLLTLHRDLQDINDSIKETNKLLKKLDEQLDAVNQSLVEIYNGMNENFSQLNANMDRNFKQMGEKIDSVGEKVEKGFERTFQMQVKQLAATEKISRQVADLTTITENGFGQVIENQIFQQQLSKETLNEVRNVNRNIGDLKEGQERQIAIANATLHVTHDVARNQVRTLNEIQGMRVDVNRGLQDVRKDLYYGFNAVQNTMQAGFEKLDNSIWQSSDRVIQSNKQMYKGIQQQIKASQPSNSGGSSNNVRSIFGKVLGGVAGAVATFYGGPIAGAAAGTFVDKIVSSGGKAKGKDVITDTVKDTAVDYVSSKNPVAGGILRDVTQNVDGKTIFTNAARTAIDQKYPGASKVVESVLETIKTERKTSLLAAAAKLAGEQGLLPNEIGLISNCRDARSLEQAIKDIAKRIQIKPEIIMYVADHIQ